ncbi:hypothetical protein ACFQY7_49965 [Actinomadura luteofluorescens]|uniref:Uncharacterized protein n=1 Tax=Actinomadura luteofluorescens TaxID=46163 RepID=A0A7Y9EF69_9ACTN|nr:hypothetical protein [Actinomadura luteofluorescens]NYD46661.1 hypothetical protein [Actinomadura luteofluorescens]
MTLNGIIGHRPQPFLEFEMGVAAPAFAGDERCTYGVPTAATVEAAVQGIYATLSSRKRNTVLALATDLIAVTKGRWQPEPGVLRHHEAAYTLTLGWFQDGGFCYPFITVTSRAPEMPALPEAGSIRNWLGRLVSHTVRCGAVGNGSSGKTFWAVVDFQEI